MNTEIERSLRHFVCLVTLALTCISAPAEEAPKLEPIGEEAYQAVIRFFEYDKTIPLEAQIVERKETETTVRWKIVFRGVRGFLAPGYLEIPKEGAAPYPCVLLMHGWSGSKTSWWQDDNYISGGNARTALLAEGIAVFALDAQAHGDRIAENDYALVNNLVEEGLDTHINYFTLREIYVQTTTDYRRGIDYLAERPEIDSDRLGILGYSMGGTQSFMLTALEPEIKVTVACVVPAMPEKFGPVAPQNYVRGIGNRPYLMLMGRTDTMCPVDLANQLFDLIPSEHKELLFFESGHRLPSDYVNDAIKWFKTHL